MTQPHRTGGPGDDDAPLLEVNAVIFGRMALITLVVVMAVAFSARATDLSQHVPLAFLVVLSAGLAVAYHRAARGADAVRPLLATQLLVDVAVISYLLVFTGGASSPFVPLYLLAPLLGGVFLTVRGGALLAAASSIAYLVLVAAERGGMLPPMSFGLTEPLSASALTVRAVLYVPLFFVVGLIGGALGRSLREGRRALEETRAELNRALFDTETILENLSSGLASIDAEGVVRHWNRAAGEILGVAPEAVRGQRYETALGAGLEAFTARLRETLETGVPAARHEATVTTRSGRVVPMGVSTSLLRDGEGKRRGVIALFQDLSDVKALEERIRRGETLAAIGELSAGIAHEIRNCLNPIAGSVEVLQRELKVSGENARLLDLIVRESERLDNFIRELLDYARERPLKTERVDVGELLREIAEVARRHPSGDARKRIVVEAGADPIWIQVDFEQMKQVLLNLLLNALEAIEGSGTVTVVAAPPGTVPRRRSGSRSLVSVEIRDTGVGIPPEELGQVFEPFFSTKQGGTGLGLAIANRIVERHGGTLEIESRVGAGTTLRLWLPRAEHTAEVVAHAA
ncbi:MAG: two-component system sensor histidine kinase NtrB [Hyphomicrobiales bacterium]